MNKLFEWVKSFFAPTKRYFFISGSMYYENGTSTNWSVFINTEKSPDSNYTYFNAKELKAIVKQSVTNKEVNNIIITNFKELTRKDYNAVTNNQ